MTTLGYPHIATDEHGIPWIAGSRTKVAEVVLDRISHHWDADEIRRQHPHLTLAQIYSALAYYYDHQAEVDRDIEQRLRQEDELVAGLDPSLLRARLNTLGRQP